MLQLLVISLIFFIVGCGRKRKDLFVFEKNSQQVEAVRRLETVKQVTVEIQQGGDALIKWVNSDLILRQELKGKCSEELALKLQKSERFLGYNVYRLRSWGIIPRKPLNIKPLVAEFFRDKQAPENECCYAVCMVFAHEKMPKKPYEGPMSKIVAKSCT